MIASGNLDSLVVCIAFTGKESRRQIGVEKVIVSRSLVSVVVCIDKEPYTYVSVDKVISSRSLGSVVVCIDLTGN